MNDINSNNPYQNASNGNFPGMQQPVPNATGVLVLGILSIVFCWCYGVLGLILGIIALVLAGSANKTYKSNPALYTANSYSNLKAGRICAIIGLVLNVLIIVYFIWIILYLGIDNLKDPTKIQEMVEQLQNR